MCQSDKENALWLGNPFSMKHGHGDNNLANKILRYGESNS